MFMFPYEAIVRRKRRGSKAAYTTYLLFEGVIGSQVPP